MPKMRVRAVARVYRQWIIRFVGALCLCGVCAWFYVSQYPPQTRPAKEPLKRRAEDTSSAKKQAGSAASGTLHALADPAPIEHPSHVGGPEQAGLRGSEGSKQTGKKQTKSQTSATKIAQIGARKDSTGSIPVALRGLSVEEWMEIEKEHGQSAKAKLIKGSKSTAKQGSAGVFGAVDVALPLSPPILQYELGSGSGQAQKNIVGLKSLTKSAKAGRKCIVYGMGIAEESDFEQMMAVSGCETHAFDCTVDYEAEAVYKKKFTFHQWCIGAKPADSQSSGENTYSSSATVRIQGDGYKVVSGGKGGGGNRADFYVEGKQIKFSPGRGFNVVTLDPVSHKVLSKKTYDTFEQRDQDNARLAADLKNVPHGHIVLMAVMDTGLENLNPDAREAMEALGASKFDATFRESYGFIGRQGYDKVAESRSRDMPSRLVFKTLAQTMKELGHTYLDLLKFDIEGFEWLLFASEVLTQDREHLPEQISFELHTKAANPAYVPQDVVGKKGYKEVNKLMLDLYNAGYRITSKEVNNGDRACAEFVALNVL